MSRTEAAMVAVFVFVAGPLSFLVMGWWLSAWLSMSGIVPMAEEAVMICGLAGLSVGIVVTGLRWRRWVEGFYGMRQVLAAPIYLFWSAIAVAFVMGLPVGNLMLGLLAGLYVGRRALHAGRGMTRLARDARQVSLFAAAITGFICLAMGMLAMKDQHTLQSIMALVGMGQLAATATARGVVVAIAVPALVGLQYWLTRAGAYWAFRLGRGESPARGTAPCA